MGNHRWLRRLCNSGLKLLKRECSSQGVKDLDNLFQQGTSSHLEHFHVFTLEETEPDQTVDPLLTRETKTRRYWDSGWRISYDNPERIIEGFSKFHVKPSLKLAAYQYQVGDNGNGIVWAIPADKTLPEPDECRRLKIQFLSPPKPSFARDEFMEAIDGGNTPLS
ncbi:hypothetical protein EVJ30_14610 [Exiguobacterium sp. SH5S13]|nr:hypothetical protein EVJ30_14610 [Exiguobacterium sp. SH5S13]